MNASTVGPQENPMNDAIAEEVRLLPGVACGFLRPGPGVAWRTESPGENEEACIELTDDWKKAEKAKGLDESEED